MIIYWAKANVVKNTEALLDTSKGVGLEVNAEKTKHCSCLVTRMQDKIHYIKIGNKSHENVAEFKNLRMMVTNQNCIHKEIKGKLNLGHVCCHAVQNLLSSHFLYRNIQMKKLNYNLLFCMGVKLCLSH
jgi:hypothetical protein